MTGGVHARFLVISFLVFISYDLFPLLLINVYLFRYYIIEIVKLSQHSSRFVRVFPTQQVNELLHLSLS